jgi:hypothetical protein
MRFGIALNAVILTLALIGIILFIVMLGVHAKGW